MKIIYLDRSSVSITGGHRYNGTFLKYLSDYSELEIVTSPKCSTIYKRWQKMYAPITELKHLRLIKKGDVVFWSDTAFKYHFILAYLVSYFKHVHSYIIIHHFPQFSKGLRGKLMKFLLFRYIKNCGNIIAPSPYTFDMANKYFPNKNILYIPIPFKKEYIYTHTYKKGSFLYVGTVERRKGLHYLVEALGIIHRENPALGFSLNIVGKITEEAYYHLLIAKIIEYDLQDAIHFRGRVSNSELEAYYNEAEIFTFPSIHEGYGIVLIEALNKGIPIIAFNNSAMPYTVKDGINGFLAEDKNAKSFAKKIMLLTGNDELRLRLQAGIQETIESLKTQKDFENGIRVLSDSIQDSKERKIMFRQL